LAFPKPLPAQILDAPNLRSFRSTSLTQLLRRSSVCKRQPNAVSTPDSEPNLSISSDMPLVSGRLLLACGLAGLVHAEGPLANATATAASPDVQDQNDDKEVQKEGAAYPGARVESASVAAGSAAPSSSHEAASSLDVNASASSMASSSGSSGGYYDGDAVNFAYLANAAYCGNLEGWSCGMPCSHTRYVSDVRVIRAQHVGVQLFVGRQGDRCVVAFKGTDSFNGFKADLQSMNLITKAGCYHWGRECRVSASFDRQYRAIANQLWEAASNLGCGGRLPMDITGHSMGAALAILTAYDFAKAGKWIGKVITFGTPRVGDDTFAGAVQDNVRTTIYRVTRADDPFVLMPGRNLGFEHAGVEVYYRGDTSDGYRVCWSSEDASCAASQAGAFAANVLKCVVPAWCGHFRYMQSQKEGLMRASSCARRLAETQFLYP